VWALISYRCSCWQGWYFNCQRWCRYGKNGPAQDRGVLYVSRLPPNFSFLYAFVLYQPCRPVVYALAKYTCLSTHSHLRNFDSF
jgi:hypothetical protein